MKLIFSLFIYICINSPCLYEGDNGDTGTSSTGVAAVMVTGGGDTGCCTAAIC